MNYNYNYNYNHNMCWSFEVSILVGLISYMIAGFLWWRNYENDRWHSIILFTFSSIQWMDAILWFNINNNTGESINKIVITFLVPLILALEPLSSMYGAAYMNKNVSYFDLFLYIILFVVLFIVFITTNSYPNFTIKDNNDRCTIRYNKNEPGDKNFYYWIFFLFLVYPIIKYNKITFFYTSLIIVIALSLIIAQLTTKSIGSNWCLYSNIITILLLLYPYLNN